MPAVEQHIKNLRDKMQLLARKQRQLEKENAQLKAQLMQLTDQQAAAKHEQEIVELQNAMLKASQQQLDDKEKKELEKKLNQFIAEIDRCISVLSR